MAQEAPLVVFSVQAEPRPHHLLAELFRPASEKILEDYAPLLNRKFDPDTVDLGRTKKPDAVKKKITDARKAFEDKKKSLQASMEKERQQDFEHFERYASIRAPGAQILCVHFATSNVVENQVQYIPYEGLYVGEGMEEPDLLRKTWAVMDTFYGTNLMCGFECFAMDLPILVFQSQAHNVPIPHWVFDMKGEWSPQFCDLKYWVNMEIPRVPYPELSHVCRVFGIPFDSAITKRGFHLSYNGSEEGRQAAIQHCSDELLAMWKLAEKLQVLR